MISKLKYAQIFTIKTIENTFINAGLANNNNFSKFSSFAKSYLLFLHRRGSFLHRLTDLIYMQLFKEMKRLYLSGREADNKRRKMLYQHFSTQQR